MPELQERYGVKFLGVFGSYATGRQKKRSDVDLLVEFERPCAGVAI
jgi:predicted nucleotidyltransferase